MCEVDLKNGRASGAKYNNNDEKHAELLDKVSLHFNNVPLCLFPDF